MVVIMPKISVIIPVYKVEKFIERCVRSLFEQTLDDIEYIFVDDCSPDESIKVMYIILEEYPHRKSQVKIIRMETNSGQAAVRQRGVKECTGEYLIHCDSDDWVRKDAYEHLYRKAKAEGADMVFSDFYVTDGIHNSLRTGDIPIDSKISLLSDVILNVHTSVWRYLCKRDLFEKNDIVFSKYNMGEDICITTQLIFYSQKFSYLQEPLYYYYMNPTYIMNSSGPDKCIGRMEQTKGSTDTVITFFQNKNLMNSLKTEVLSLKLACRFYVSELTNTKNGRQLWFSIYPEVSFKEVLFDRKLPTHQKLHFLAVYFYLYNLIRYIQKMR